MKQTKISSPAALSAALIIFLSNSVLVSCDAFVNAKPQERLEMVHQGLRNQDKEFLVDLGKKADHARGLLEVHPGAAWFLAQRLLSLDLEEDARSLLVRQIEAPDPVYGLMAFKDWLTLCQKTPAGRNLILEAGPAYFERMDQTQDLFVPAQLLYDQARLEALEEAARIDEMEAAAQEVLARRLAQPELVLPQRPLGESPVESWLLFALAREPLVSEPGQGRIPPVMEALAAYAFSSEARAGHDQVLRLHKKRLPDFFGPVMVEYLKAKHNLALGQAAKALDGFGLVAASLDKLAGEFSLPLVQRAGLDGLVKDAYSAARQCQRPEQGVKVLRIMADYFAKDYPALSAYAWELMGRLEISLPKPAVSRKSFARALELPLNIQDRRRILWYLVSTYLDEAKNGKDRISDWGGLVAALAQADGNEYLTEVQEDSLALLARNGRFQDLENLFYDYRASMTPGTQYRLAFILASEKARQTRTGKAVSAKEAANPPAKAVKKGKAAKSVKAIPVVPKPRLPDPLAFLQEQRTSVYYFAMASWLGGVQPDLEQFLGQSADTPEPMPELDDAAEAARARVKSVAQGFEDLGLLDGAFDYAWTWRKSLEPAFIFKVVKALQDQGRYREAQRLGDSVRLRLGHPEDRDVLMLMYPLALQDIMDPALDKMEIPRSLWYSLIRTESAFDTSAQSRVGARGLSQLMPGTEKEVARRSGISDNPEDPRVNLRIGALYLQDQYSRYKAWPYALAAYNAGPGRVKAWLKDDWAQDPWNLAEQAPLAETRNYVRRITESALFYEYLYGESGEGAGFLASLVVRH